MVVRGLHKQAQGPGDQSLMAHVLAIITPGRAMALATILLVRDTIILAQTVIADMATITTTATARTVTERMRNPRKNLKSLPW